MADYLGDKTPRFKGRLSFNPLDHMDPIGFIMLIVFRFGWTKPVETNPSAYKRGYKDAYKVAIAPIIALLMAGFLASLVTIGMVRFGFNFMGTSFYGILMSIVQGILSVCVSLSIFNLIPLPGLAGFEILKAVKPKFVYEYGEYFYRYQTLILIGIIYLGQNIIRIPVIAIYNLFIEISSKIFF